MDTRPDYPSPEHLARVPSSRREPSHVSSQGKEAASVTHDIYDSDNGWGMGLGAKNQNDAGVCTLAEIFKEEDDDEDEESEEEEEEK